MKQTSFQPKTATTGSASWQFSFLISHRSHAQLSITKWRTQEKKNAIASLRYQCCIQHILKKNIRHAVCFSSCLWLYEAVRARAHFCGVDELFWSMFFRSISRWRYCWKYRMLISWPAEGEENGCARFSITFVIPDTCLRVETHNEIWAWDCTRSRE